MKHSSKSKVSTLFLDIGGVLLTNGWDRHSRELAASTFDLDLKDFNDRHALTFDIYEMGKISLEEYLNRVIFYKKRSFTQKQFQDFMFECSVAYPQMLELMTKLKAKYHLKVAVVSNEGRELTEHRIKKFKLEELADFFVSSCFVHLKKPDNEIYQFALDLAQKPKEEILYVDDRGMFIEVAEKLGIPSLHHVDYESTVAKLKTHGLEL